MSILHPSLTASVYLFTASANCATAALSAVNDAHGKLPYARNAASSCSLHAG